MSFANLVFLDRRLNNKYYKVRQPGEDAPETVYGKQLELRMWKGCVSRSESWWHEWNKEGTGGSAVIAVRVDETKKRQVKAP